MVSNVNLHYYLGLFKWDGTFLVSNDHFCWFKPLRNQPGLINPGLALTNAHSTNHRETLWNNSLGVLANGLSKIGYPIFLCYISFFLTNGIGSGAAERCIDATDGLGGERRGAELSGDAFRQRSPGIGSKPPWLKIRDPKWIVQCWWLVTRFL